MAISTRRGRRPEVGAPQRMRRVNFDVFDFELSDDEMARIATMDRR